MIYQLPNGKIIQLSIDEYLDLTDQDIQYMMSVNAGDYASSPFYGSAIKKPGRSEDSDAIEEDISIDYQEELDEPLGGASETNLEEDDYTDLPDNV